MITCQCTCFRNFTGSASTTPYSYDNNGNLTGDAKKGTVITYNELNKPVRISQNGSGKYIEYGYDASGVRIKKTIYDGTVITSYTYYIDGFVFTTTPGFDVVLSYFSMPEGRVRANVGFSYEYFITDHQGNVRVSFEDDGSGNAVVRQENSYYPFGMGMPGNYLPTLPNKHLYNAGSEWQDEFDIANYYSTFFREYDPTIGRFNSVDPLAAASVELSVYHYAANNPVNFNDPLGLVIQPAYIPLPEVAVVGYRYKHNWETVFTFSDLVGEYGMGWEYGGSPSGTYIAASGSSDLGRGGAGGGNGNTGGERPNYPNIFPDDTKFPPIFWEEFAYEDIENIDRNYSYTQIGLTQTIELPGYPGYRFLVFHYEANPKNQQKNRYESRKKNWFVENPNSYVYQLHEVPYASTKEGGINSIRMPALEGHNIGHGIALRWFYDDHKMKDGDEFYVPLRPLKIKKIPEPIPVPVPNPYKKWDPRTIPPIIPIRPIPVPIEPIPIIL
jgi:RHS repeat-associated protein